MELDGKLIGPWVDELERVWYLAERAGFVHVILPIYRSGAALVAVGCLTEALPQDVIKKESAGWRGPAKEVVRADPKVSRVGLGARVIRRWFSPPGADAKEDAMRSIQEIIFSLMILVGLSMILYDVINARTVAPTAERKNLLKKSWLAEDKNSASAQ